MKQWDWHNINILWILLFTSVSLGIWAYGKTSFAFFWYTPWLYLAQAAGIVAITNMSLTFVYTTRFKILGKFFGELQHVYRIHKLNSIIGTVFIVLHVSFFMIHSISYPTLFRYYLLPGSYWALDYGRISFLLFILLTGLSFSNRIPYHIWKMTHKFMGLAMLFAMLHVVTVTSDVKYNMLLRYWLIGLMSIGGLSCIYTLFLYRFWGPKKKYVVSKVQALNSDVTEIDMMPIGKPLKYDPAQFIFLSFLSSIVGKEVHPFSITTIEEDQKLQISFKVLGDYTKKLRHLEVGTEVDIWGPYGTFSEKYLLDNRDQVWIAGGIGVTPFLSILKHQNSHQLTSNKWFLYCTRSMEDAPYHQYLEKETENHDISYHHHQSNDQGFITIDYIRSQVPDFQNKVYMLSGPTLMMKLLQKDLHRSGVTFHHVIHEDFSLR
jgi:predicted ferric reductase